MNSPPLVAVVATEPRYRALTHQPSGATLDGDGRGLWPDDSFTARLRLEGSLRLAADEPPAPPPAPLTDPDAAAPPARRSARHR